MRINMSGGRWGAMLGAMDGRLRRKFRKFPKKNIIKKYIISL